jgi:hypothetical protein
MNSTVDDPILAELFRFREQHAAAYNYDVAALMDELIHEQDELEKHGRRFASYPPRRCQQEFPFALVEEEKPLSSTPIDTSLLGRDSTPSAKP